MNLLQKKLKLKPNQTLVVINKPDGFDKALGFLPLGVKVTMVTSVPADHVFWFVKTEEELLGQQKKVLALIKSNTQFWVMYPKSGKQAISKSLVVNTLLANNTLEKVTQFTFDSDWGTIGLRRNTTV
jgi:hypothetical protein